MKTVPQYVGFCPTCTEKQRREENREYDAYRLFWDDPNSGRVLCTECNTPVDRSVAYAKYDARMLYCPTCRAETSHSLRQPRPLRCDICGEENPNG